MYSFYDSDKERWRIGSIINPKDDSGEKFLESLGTKMDLFTYLAKARTNHIWDFKSTNGTSKKRIAGIDIYRGMPIHLVSGTVYASARDVGNIAAGYVGGINGLSWDELRLGCDSYQSYITSINKKELIFDREGPSTTSAQRVGWEYGFLLWMIQKSMPR